MYEGSFKVEGGTRNVPRAVLCFDIVVCICSGESAVLSVMKGKQMSLKKGSRSQGKNSLRV